MTINKESTVQSFDPKTMRESTEQSGRSDHWQVRTNERDYAFLSDKTHQKENRYGKQIDLLDITDLPEKRSLFINENPAIGSNPNRNKQHGFFFTADNCIGCHACEAACSEKNDNPAHLAFRSVGYVEGGSYPDYKRMNISMACNHCDDPVCLKGCPTRAYTKHAEYGAVLQDPETCFGCGYCTWVCPYNAPQLDPVQGRVSKCNMCVDRLEVGLKPACVSACVGNALDFGIIENVPENREQCNTQLPGFPDPDITHPNIRFQQTKSLPIEMNRTDAMPVKYHKNQDGQYKPVVDQKQGKAAHWNFKKLSSRENPLVLFTLLSQAAVGTFIITFLASFLGVNSFVYFMKSDFILPLIIFSLVLTTLGLFMSVTHLGKPFRFYRGFNNLRYSPMSREGLGLALFSGACAVLILILVPDNVYVSDAINYWLTIDIKPLANFLPLSTMVTIMGAVGIFAGVVGLFYMNQCYRIKARPFWDHIQTSTSFMGNALSLGASVCAVFIVPGLGFINYDIQESILVLASVFTLGMLIEAIGLASHSYDLNRNENEDGAAHYVQCTTFGKTYCFRNVLLALNIFLSIGLIISLLIGELLHFHVIAWAILICINVITAVIGRALFYILVIPTTMPGAFFWKNKAFEQHARDVGLADNPAAGIAPLAH